MSTNFFVQILYMQKEDIYTASIIAMTGTTGALFGWMVS